MRWLHLYLRSRQVPRALATATATTALVWALWLRYAHSEVINDRLMTLTVMLAVTAFAATLSGADDDLDHTASIGWPARRAGHLLLTAAVIMGLLLCTTVTGARFAPLVLVVRNTAGLLGLTALGAALLGVSRSWIAPVSWALISILPMVEPSTRVRMQLAGWLIQPAGTTAATVCACVLAAAGLVAYTVRGCPPRPAAEAVPDQ